MHRTIEVTATLIGPLRSDEVEILSSRLLALGARSGVPASPQDLPAVCPFHVPNLRSALNLFVAKRELPISMTLVPESRNEGRLVFHSDVLENTYSLYGAKPGPFPIPTGAGNQV